MQYFQKKHLIHESSQMCLGVGSKYIIELKACDSNETNIIWDFIPALTESVRITTTTTTTTTTTAMATTTTTTMATTTTEDTSSSIPTKISESTHNK